LEGFFAFLCFSVQLWKIIPYFFMLIDKSIQPSLDIISESDYSRLVLAVLRWANFIWRLISAIFAQVLFLFLRMITWDRCMEV